MADVRNEKTPEGQWIKLAIVALTIIGVLAFLYVIIFSLNKPGEDAGLLSYRQGALAKLEIPGEPMAPNPRFPDLPVAISPPGQSLPTTPIMDADGKMVTLETLKGQVLVVNMWATWCAPCKVEMPTLEALAAVYAAQPMKVVTITVDAEEDHDKARAEIAKYPHLPLYFDTGFKMAFGMTPPSTGMPTTILFDKKGIERARLSADADWNSPEARALIERLLKD